ncbi:MAG TPA: DUF2283 domain-containing protein [Candidatus Deferrimicrobium sp.]|nr:DUF2283 domain-containing protein [Candidatus Deferrimicrobium sp.]
MKIKYDSKADAIYILLQDRKYDISKEIEEGIIVDYTREGKIIGIDILKVSQKIDPKDLEEITVLIPIIKEEV